MKELNNLNFWKYLTNFWSLLTMLIFAAAFFAPEIFNCVLSSISIIYAAILSIYVGSKEIARWRNKDFVSKHFGEFFLIVWTIIIVSMILLSIINKNFEMRAEFTATYITILGLFAISQKSKTIKRTGNSKKTS